MFHHGGENESAHKRDTQRVSHRLVVLVEGIFVDVQSQLGIQVFEKYTAQVVAFGDNDCILLAQLDQIRECRTEHRVGGNIPVTALLIEIMQFGLDGCYITDDTVLRQMRQHFFECRYRIFHRHGVDDQLGFERVYLLECGETLCIVREAHTFRILLVHGGFVVKTEQVEEEAAHFSGSKN